MRQPLPSIGAVLVKLRRDDGYRERVMSNNSAWHLGPVGLRRPIVITEETTDPLAAPHAAALRLNVHAVDQFVAKPLVVALAMVTDREVGERAPEVPLTQQKSADPGIRV